jgi:hypothetical protein
MNRLWQWPGVVFALVMLWKVFLAITTAQPVPANDSFFYDGAVVNYLLHGEYVNPALAAALPISGGEVFSAYPPLYQPVLLLWMKVFGTSALAAVFLHLLLFGFYAWLLYLILQSLGATRMAMGLAGLFLFGITFHDRPDTLAHVFGMAAILSWIQACVSQPAVPQTRGAILPWVSALFVILCLGTSIQIGATYAFIVSACMAIGCYSSFSKHNDHPGVAVWLRKIGPVFAMVLIPIVGVLLVIWLCPRCWAGFLEHTRQPPTFVGFRMIAPADVIKVLRTVPGILLLTGLVLVISKRGNTLRPTIQDATPPTAQSPGADRRDAHPASCGGMLFFLTLAAALLVIIASLVAFSANVVAIANYLQPLLAGLGIMLVVPRINPSQHRVVRWLFIAAVLLVGIRAIGMSAWGALLSTELNYREALKATRGPLQQVAPNQTAVVSAAYLYDATAHSNARLIHSDWLGPARPRDEVFSADEDLIMLRPSMLILTQFDYYRRYEHIIRSVKTRPELVSVRVRNRAILPAPDSSPLLQRVVQHISWAPVIVELSWKE